MCSTRNSYAGALAAGKTLPVSWRLRFSAEYDLASGNRSPNGKTIGTFDQTYLTNHLFYEALDIIGWLNMC